MLLIALTGGIASGKSMVAARLAALGAVHIDADLLAREVVEPGTPGLAAVLAEFGPGVELPGGGLDRAALGAIIFADGERRQRLNEITHPLIHDLVRQRIAEAEAADLNAIVIYDVPLLAETRGPISPRFDVVVVVHADRETRLRRLVELRGLSRAEGLHRLNSQASDTDRLAIADVVLDNNGTPEELMGQVEVLWESLRQRMATAATR